MPNLSGDSLQCSFCYFGSPLQQHWHSLQHYRAALAKRQMAAPAWQRLINQGSLTAVLKAECFNGFSVRLIKQGIGRPKCSEAQRLQMRSGELALIREVELLNGDTPWVFAHSVIPLATVDRQYRYLSRMGTRPLGEALFSDPKIHRGKMEISQLDNHTWGRRSVFHVHSHRLLVCEYFLPSWGQ